MSLMPFKPGLTLDVFFYEELAKWVKTYPIDFKSVYHVRNTGARC